MTGIVHGRAGQHLVERRLVVARGAGRRARERHVLVQRRVLVARRGLDRGDDLARDAELGEVAKARLAVGAVVAHRLVEADQALLDEIVGVAAGEEVRRRLQPDESVVPTDDPVICIGVSLLCQRDQITILNLRLRLRIGGQSGHEQHLSSPRRRREFGFRGALPPLAPHHYSSSRKTGLLASLPSTRALKLELILICGASLT